MQQNTPTSFAPPSRSNKGIYAALVVSLILLAGVAAAIYLFHSYQTSQAASYSDTLASFVVGPDGIPAGLAKDVAPQESISLDTEPNSEDTPEEIEEEYPEGFPTPVVAEYDGILIHSPIAPAEINGIMFHQASFKSALIMQTQLPTADPEDVERSHNFGIAQDQPTGDEYLQARALHIWRVGADTEMDTSLDIGAEAGTQVYAPITGTVVLIREYDLFDTCKDFEVHIQPDGREDLDVVEIHISDVSVKENDHVIGGVTPLAKVRDINAEGVDEIQLAGYTDAGHGNHTHVQINDATSENYWPERKNDSKDTKDEDKAEDEKNNNESDTPSESEPEQAPDSADEPVTDAEPEQFVEEVVYEEIEEVVYEQGYEDAPVDTTPELPEEAFTEEGDIPPEA